MRAPARLPPNVVSGGVKQGDEAQTVTESLRCGRDYLREKRVEEPRLNSELLLADVLGVQRLDLYLYPERKVSRREDRFFKRRLEQRGRGEPLQYLTGKVGFYGLTFQVRKGVFIPRPETELLIDAALSRIKGAVVSPPVLDVGAGCGAVGLSLARHTDAKIFLIDKNLRAVRTAAENRRRLGLTRERVVIKQADFKTFTANTRCKFGFIVSNPPYIPAVEKRQLSREVRREPPEALFAGDEGLDFIRLLLMGSEKILLPGGHLIFEIGCGQREKVVDLIRETGFRMVEVIKDLAGIDRIMVCQNP